MINVVVVEDKHPILRNLVRKIENYSEKLQVIGEATDGLSALNMCLQLKPNIVFTDIRMPGIDGLEFIKTLKQQCPDIIFVIISGYDDFQNAREALRLGVKEFLLKPVSQQSMDATLKNVMELAEETFGAKEEQLIYNVLRGRQLQADALKAMSLNHSFFVMIICAGSISKFTLDLSHPYHDIWFRFDMMNFLTIHENMHREDTWIFEGDAMNEVVIVCRMERNQDFSSERLFHSLQEALAPYHLHTFTCAISNRADSLANLKLEYQLTRMILSHHAEFGSSKLIMVNNYSLNDASQVDPEKFCEKQKLISYIKNNNKEAFQQEIWNTLEKWKQAACTQANIDICLTHMVQWAYQAYHHQGTVSHEIQLELNEIISISKNYSSLYRNVMFLFERFFYVSTAQEDESQTIKHAIEKIDQYFQDHLAEELAIADIADMVKFNSSFLSREFKKIKGISPIEYLTKLRIEKAKQLILEPSNHKFKDIGTMVGYSNPYYFSKVFKVITGMTPSLFKQEMSKTSS
ncbi:response regulator [Paenibacillus sp. FSL R10-2734]|uniref:response regulator n=1 Tax=Paenibacillus sp. FSL R10-2734 TaxID=2954691 RepID=UPI0030DD629B